MTEEKVLFIDDLRSMQNNIWKNKEKEKQQKVDLFLSKGIHDLFTAFKVHAILAVETDTEFCVLQKRICFKSLF